MAPGEAKRGANLKDAYMGWSRHELFLQTWSKAKSRVTPKCFGGRLGIVDKRTGGGGKENNRFRNRERSTGPKAQSELLKERKRGVWGGFGYAHRHAEGGGRLETYENSRSPLQAKCRRTDS